MGKFLAQTQLQLVRLMTTFSNVVQNLNSPEESSMLNMDLCINPVLAVVEKYKHHQSIISINKKMRKKGLPNFSFHFVILE